MFFALIGAHLGGADAAIVELPGAAHDPQHALFRFMLQTFVLGLDEGLYLPAEFLTTPIAAQNGFRGTLRTLLRQVFLH
jgi:hypothetical protein